MLIVDDITNSESQQALAWKWWREIAYPRLNSGGKALLVGARQPNDLIGKVLDEDPTWEHLDLKAIAEEGDILCRPVGAALWPSKWPVEELIKIRVSMLNGPFESQYQGNPSTGEEPVFSVNDFQAFSSLPKPEARWNPIWLATNYDFPLESAYKDGSEYLTLLSIDCAGTENRVPEKSTNSYHAILAVTMDLTTSNVYVLSVEKLKGNYQKLFEAVLFANAMRAPEIILVETSEGIGGELFGELKARMRAEIRSIKPRESKRERCLSVVDMIKSGKVFVREADRKNLDPRKRSNADAIDCLTQALQVCKELRANHRTIPSPITPSGLF